MEHMFWVAEDFIGKDGLSRFMPELEWHDICFKLTGLDVGPARDA